MTPTEQAADRVKALVEELQLAVAGFPRGELGSVRAMDVPSEFKRPMREAADALTALQARTETAEGERDEARRLFGKYILDGSAQISRAEFLLALMAAVAEDHQIAAMNLGETARCEGLDRDDWQDRAEAAEAERDALREGLEQAAMELDEAANVLVVTMPSLGSLFRAASGKARALLSSPPLGNEGEQGVERPEPAIEGRGDPSPALSAEAVRSGKWRKRPVVIDAFRLGYDPQPDWFCDKVTANEITTHNTDGRWRGGPDYALINGLEGQLRAEDSGGSALMEHDIREALAKADQIIALHAHSPSVESGRVLTSEEATMLDRAHMRGVKVIGEIDAPPPFIQWNGGENPAPGKRVDVKYRNGEIDPDAIADHMRWHHSTNQRASAYDIIAYRIIPTDGAEADA